MWGSLGDVAFEMSSIPEGFEKEIKVDFSEHKIVEGKPLLQYSGERLIETSIKIKFHHLFCDVDKEIEKIRSIIGEGYHLFVVNGKKIGYFVLESMREIYKRMNKNGKALVVELELRLKEYK